MVDTAVQTVGEVAARLAWPHYQQLLGHFLKAMQRLGEANKVRLLAPYVCSNLNTLTIPLRFWQCALPECPFCSLS